MIHYRQDVGCFGEETCFSLAFGVPAALVRILYSIQIFKKILKGVFLSWNLAWTLIILSYFLSFNNFTIKYVYIINMFLRLF